MAVPRAAVRLTAAVAVFLAAVVAVTVVLVSGGDGGEEDGQQTQRPAPPGQSGPERRPAVVVKIDNVDEARPQTGLSAADVVYVEPVEGGLTRLAAVYASRTPEAVGPVRSARETDVQLLRQYRRPVLAYSGGAPEIEPLLRNAPLTQVTDKTRPQAYFRGDDRPIPHNLYVRPGQLPGQDRAAPPRPVTDTGPAPRGGREQHRHEVGFRSADYAFTWSAAERRWQVSLDGTPVTTTEAGRATAGTVVVQHVDVREGRQVRDSGGQLSPVAVTVGRGEATVLRDGKAFDGTWSREKPGDRTTYRTDAGEPLRVGENGPVWVLLTPR